MTSSLAPPDRTGRSIARHLVGWQVVGLWDLFLYFLAGVALFGVGAHLIVEVTGSLWRGATQWLHWFAIGMGVYLTAVYLPLYVSHGRTRRAFAAGAAVFAVALALWLGVATLVGYAVETGIYHLLGWADLLIDPHPLRSVGSALTLFSEHAAVYLAFTTVGAVAGAAFYRRVWLGLLLAVPCLAVIVGTAVVMFDDGAIFWLPIDREGSALLLRLVPSLLATVVAMAVGWWIVRDVPLRNRPG